MHTSHAVLCIWMKPWRCGRSLASMSCNACLSGLHSENLRQGDLLRADHWIPSMKQCNRSQVGQLDDQHVRHALSRVAKASMFQWKMGFELHDQDCRPGRAPHRYPRRGWWEVTGLLHQSDDQQKARTANVF